jgi:hypothetical protein
MRAPGLHSAHNGYLDVYLDGGLIGVGLLFSILLLQGSRLAREARGNRYQLLKFAWLIVVIIYNLTESAFVRLGPMWFTTLLVLINPRFLSREVATVSSVAGLGEVAGSSSSRQRAVVERTGARAVHGVPRDCELQTQRGQSRRLGSADVEVSQLRHRGRP